MLSLENFISLAMRMRHSGIGFGMIKIKKSIRSRNVTFNKMVVCKNNSSTELVSTGSEAEKPEFINLDGISKGASQRRNSEVDKDSETEEDPEVEETIDQHIE
jgi:hypothetical protein